MLLQYLVENVDSVKVIGNTNVEVNKIEYDSKKIGKSDIFVAIKGYENDGNEYIKEAILSGAIAIILEKEDIYIIDELKEYSDVVTFVEVENARIALAKLAAVYYDFPARKLKLIGVTGTKGKTTTVYMIRDILLASGKKTGMIGTIYNTYGDVKIESSRTSPESLDLHKLLKEMVDSGVEYVVMEVSSHALELNRVYGLKFVISVFTNLSQDHLDFHGTMDNYLQAKAKLFKISDFALINGDDIYAPKLIKMIETKSATFGLDNAVNLTATDIKINSGYVEFKMYINKMLQTVRVNIPGRYTVYNALAAIGVCSMLNSQLDSILLALSNICVPGRSEIVNVGKTFTIMIDYAHTPSSLEAILAATKKHAKGRIICVFGCGGNRDTTKRAMMGEVSGRLADFTVITTDNPRNEEPRQIMGQIEEGMKKTKGLFKSIENRKEAIKFAMRIAWKNDIIILAGKGHETYQVLKNNKKIHFDEREVVKQLAEEMPDKNIETNVLN
ncbi:MAG: UDP-N-acetylmuramoyl-L-alanyl-D-glutamate--2,6-diaminopimelate ligase [Clostridia bacterium]|nr:UDP-N-acetylmuramoyl-L-alanyl-D-glutamate--2,6-diaminopimelate ligase [Clostridia bacterium]